MSRLKPIVITVFSIHALSTLAQTNSSEDEGYEYFSTLAQTNSSEDEEYEYPYYPDVEPHTPCPDAIGYVHNGTVVQVGCGDACGKYRDNVTCIDKRSLPFLESNGLSTPAVGDKFPCNVGTCQNGSCVNLICNETCQEFDIPPTVADDYYLDSKELDMHTRCPRILLYGFNGSQVPIGCSDKCGTYVDNATCIVPTNKTEPPCTSTTAAPSVGNAFYCEIGICKNGTCVLRLGNQTCENYTVATSPVAPRTSDL